MCQLPHFRPSATRLSRHGSAHLHLSHRPAKGCTALESDFVPPGAPNATKYTLMTAYKLFENDPVLFNNGFKVRGCKKYLDSDAAPA